MRLSFALCSLSLILLFSSPALSTAEGPDFWAIHNVAANDTLNIRSEPNMKAKIVGTIPHDARHIENLGEFFPPAESDMSVPKWCKVKYKDVAGWVGCKFLREDAGE